MVIDILIIIGSALAIWGFSDMLSKGTDSVGKRFAINPGVRGATLDAVASSFPEFCTVIFALQAGAFEAGVGAIAGSALYNILIIPAVSVFVGGTLKIEKGVVRRDGFLYAAVVVILFLVIYFGPQSEGPHGAAHLLSWYVGLVFILIYAAYVVLLVLQARRGSEAEAAISVGGSVPIDHEDDAKHEFKPLKVAAFLLIGILGIGLATHFLVDASLHLFKELHFSVAIAGVTVLAAATSLPDTLLSVFAVKRDDADGAVSNAFGSNSFDILICLGLPILIMGGLHVTWADSWPILSFLVLSTFASIAFLVTNWSLTRKEAIFMIIIYLVFMVLAFTGIL